ncbi:hypothetical protein DTO271D3_8659 [Paecilomyces variotii]|nr:hypothetical protein DTO271D3_8659 [Paecilomyces variotii]
MIPLIRRARPHARWTGDGPRSSLEDDEEVDGHTYQHSRQSGSGIFRITVVIPTLVFVTVLVTGLMSMAESMSSSSYLTYSTVPGFFLQDEPDTDPNAFDYIASNFGLINRTYDTDEEFDPHGDKPQWERFENKIRSLARDSGKGVHYKVLFLGRHGEGYHNVAESFYGTEAWDCYWSLQDGNETSTWVDAHLTETGIAQAETAHHAWEKQIENKVPAPESYYVSPLNRCLATASITFSGLELPNIDPFQPTVKELLRETIGLHTCDRRSSKSAIAEEYPHYRFEPDFSDEDVLWDAKSRESDSARSVRLRKLLDDIFTNDENVFISLTAHSGAITSILEVIGHRKFQLATGAMIPVVVKAERISGEHPEEPVEPPTTAPKCEINPIGASTARGVAVSTKA